MPSAVPQTTKQCNDCPTTQREKNSDEQNAHTRSVVYGLRERLPLRDQVQRERRVRNAAMHRGGESPRRFAGARQCSNRLLERVRKMGSTGNSPAPVGDPPPGRAKRLLPIHASLLTPGALPLSVRR